MKLKIALIGIVCTLFTISVSAQDKSQSQTTTALPLEAHNTILKSEVSELFADNIDLRNPKKMLEIANTLNKSIGHTPTTREEDLTYPAIDLYGEHSWNTSSLLPFKDRNVQVNLPDSFHIDCSQFVYPLDKIERVNSHYGYRRRFGRMHYGIDLDLNVGDTVRASFDGKVRLVEYDRRGYGKYVVIRHPNGLETLYGHLSSQIVKPNDIVMAGDPIGLGGNTGRSTGPHLHYETRLLGFAINPAQIIDFHLGVPINEQYLFVKQHAGKSWSGKQINKYASARATGIKVHKIRNGETLSHIAKRYGTTVNKICRLNGISKTTTLRIGRTLRISE